MSSMENTASLRKGRKITEAAQAILIYLHRMTSMLRTYSLAQSLTSLMHRTLLNIMPIKMKLSTLTLLPYPR